MGYQLILSVGDIVDGQYRVIDKWHNWRTKSRAAGWRWRLLDLNTNRVITVNWWDLRKLFYGREAERNTKANTNGPR